MNTKIFSFLIENLTKNFNLPKYSKIKHHINGDTVISELPWTPAKLDKFSNLIERTFFTKLPMDQSVKNATAYLDDKYLHKFFGEIWKPHTSDYAYTGTMLADNIIKHNPKNVIDVGCGYNEFKDKIPNLIGIDPYNNAADYMVDILEFTSAKQFDAVVALGSINFGTYDDIEQRFAKCISLLADGGRMYMRVNPGLQHKNGPWVEIFKWDFAVADKLAQKFTLTLESYKTDLDRLYLVYVK